MIRSRFVANRYLAGLVIAFAVLHVATVIEELRIGPAEQREVLGVRPRAPIPLADEDVAARARPGLELAADARHAARHAAAAQHDGEMECLRIRLEIADVDTQTGIRRRDRRRTGCGRRLRGSSLEPDGDHAGP